MNHHPPSGTVTFLFTDIEGSTPLWERAPEKMAEALQTHNQALRQAFEERAKIPVKMPPLALCTDNAAMTAAVGHRRFLAGQRDALDIDVLPTWPISEQ